MLFTTQIHIYNSNSYMHWRSAENENNIWKVFIQAVFGNAIETMFFKNLIFLFKINIFLYFQIILICWY
jgi:hypothetical protein